jgi:hypothetical protein
VGTAQVGIMSAVGRERNGVAWLRRGKTCRKWERPKWERPKWEWPKWERRGCAGTAALHCGKRRRWRVLFGRTFVAAAAMPRGATGGDRWRRTAERCNERPTPTGLRRRAPRRCGPRSACDRGYLPRVPGVYPVVPVSTHRLRPDRAVPSSGGSVVPLPLRPFPLRPFPLRCGGVP